MQNAILGRKHLWHRLILIVTLVIMVACDTLPPFGPDATPSATEDVGTAIPDLPMPAPKLLFRTPEPHAPHATNAVIELVFDQPMDQHSVTRAFEITPKTSGDLIWVDARTLQFTPTKPLSRGAQYQVIVNKRARNAEGTALVEPITFTFETVGFIEVSDVQPAPDSHEIDPATTITVFFNHPIVPLTSIEQQADLPIPLDLDPPVQGEGEWLNTSVYRFRPTMGLRPAATYTARVTAGLEDSMGSVLANDYVWTFTTVRPAVTSWVPETGAEFVGPNEPITVTFNQPMDHASTEAAFELRMMSERVEGRFHWTGGKDQLDVETMVFTPDHPLPRNAVCEVTIDRSARARESEVTMEDVVTWTFWTVNDPGIISVYPRDGADEIPVSLDIEIAFASPMRQEGFLEYVTIIPQPTSVYTYWSASYTEMRLAFSKEPATSYRVILSPDALDRYGVRLGAGLDTQFTTGDLSPYAYLSTSGRIGAFNAYTNTVLYVRHRNVSRLDLKLYQLPLDTFFMLYGYGSYSYRSEYQPPASELVRAWSIQSTAPRNEGRLRRITLTNAQGDQLPPGIYYLELTTPELQASDPERRPESFAFIRSHTNLILKQSEFESMVWATDLATGQPVSGEAISFYREGKVEEGKGITDARGLWIAKDLAAVDLWDDYFAVIGQPGEDKFAIAYNNWDYGIRPWDYDLPSAFGSSDYIGYLYTDRPIYRPGQPVYFKGIARENDDLAYHLPSELTQVIVQITDPTGKEVYSEWLVLNDMGAFDSAFTLSNDAALGTYYIEAHNDGFFSSTNFRVAEYRKPEFQIEVATDQLAYLSGDTIEVAVEASYYFGGPVGNADVTWTALSAPYYFEYQCPAQTICPRYAWTDYEYESDYGEYIGDYGKQIAEGATETDAQGVATFNISSVIEEEIQSRQFTLEATITDINDQAVSQRTTAIVHQGAFYIGIAPDRRVTEAGSEQTVHLLAADWDSQAVSGVKLEVVVMERHWYSVREESDDGYAYWTWTTEDVPVYTSTARTHANGKATITYTPKASGCYRVRATGTDEWGNIIRSSTYLWVWGSGSTVWRRESNNRIDLITDRDSYNVGDTAEILITSPYSGPVQALITIERGHIMDTEVRTLESSTELLRIPIKAAYTPNVFVSVVLMQGSTQSPEGLASFKMGQVMLPVSTNIKQLKITLTPDKNMASGGLYHPRETAVYDVQVTDNDGNPVEAELSLRLADLAVLALTDDTGPTLLERFWSERGLGVRTSTPLVVTMEAYNRELAPQAKGGGGAEDTDGGLIRTDFADTAFWEATVRTDSQGQAQVEVPLPDNLTTWRMQARGITADTLVGRSEVDIRSTLDLLVRPVLPRFFVIGDEATIATIVHNNTTEAFDAQVTLTVNGLEVVGETVQQVTLAAGENARVNWPVKVLTAEEVIVQMEARSGALYDGRKDTLPVYAYTTPEIVGTAGQISEPELRQEIVQLPRTLNPDQGELTIKVDGSLTAATQDALTYLEHYRYECVEQTVSRFLPNVLTFQTLTEMGQPQPELEQKLRDSVGIAVQRLYNEQHYDGGWGWWVSDRSNAYLTAYVLQGLLEAHRAGFAVEPYVIQRAAGFLRENLTSVNANTPSWMANRLAYQLYVLGEYVTLVEVAEAEGELGRAVTLFDHRDQLDKYGQAMLVMALGLLRRTSPDDNLSDAAETQIKTLLSDLAGDAVMSATGTHWEEDEPDIWNMNTDIRTTAIVLWALARHNPESPLLPNVVRWLMDVRREGFWESTNTTAWSLMGLIAYMRATGELQGDFSYTVSLNGEIMMDGDVIPQSDSGGKVVDNSQEAQIAIAQLLADQANRLIIEREAPTGAQTGEGQLYYTAHLRYFLPVAEVEPLDRGMVVTRQYSRADGSSTNMETARIGDVIRVKLTIISSTDLHYVIIEDPLPAGCEAVDATLNTTSIVGESPSLNRLSVEEEDLWYRWYGWGWWWFSHTEMQDEKVVLFATYLPRGTYEYTYIMRASVAGKYNVIPAMGYEMYFPEVFGRSAGMKFTVTAD